MYANTCRFCNYLCILYTETAYHVYTMFSCNLHVITTTLMADTALEAIGHTPHHLSESVGTTGVVCNCSVCECVCVSPNIYSMQHPPLSSCVLSSVFFLRLTASSARCTTTHTHTHTQGFNIKSESHQYTFAGIHVDVIVMRNHYFPLLSQYIPTEHNSELNKLCIHLITNIILQTLTKCLMESNQPCLNDRCRGIHNGMQTSILWQKLAKWHKYTH